MNPRRAFRHPRRGQRRSMKPDIPTLVDRYGRFERQVREQMERRCRPQCSQCRRVCCRIHFCTESRESVFLDRVVRRFSPDASWDPLHGWLSSGGCSLVAGRPPVCYEFICRDISDALSSGPDRGHALRTLGMLLTHVGKSAVGGRHLVTATGEAQLNRIRPDRFMARLEQAQAALQAAAAMLDGRPWAAAAAALNRISPASRTDAQTLRRTM